jgi:hypothetical protein
MLTIPCEQLVEGENKDRFCDSLQYLIHLGLDVLCQDVVLRLSSKPQTLVRIPYDFTCNYLHTVMSAKSGPWHYVDAAFNARAIKVIKPRRFHLQS